MIAWYAAINLGPVLMGPGIRTEDQTRVACGCACNKLNCVAARQSRVANICGNVIAGPVKFLNASDIFDHIN